jgi:RNA polymerase sporulation-specific sigma factor
MENDLNVLRDEELVKMAQEGSATAEEYLIRKYKDLAKLKSQQYFIVGGDREDVIQEGMIGIFEAIRDYDENSGAAFRTFAELCITRQIISAIKRANRKKHQILNDSISLSGENKSDEDSGDAWIEHIAAGDNANPEYLALLNEFARYLKADGMEVFSAFENKVWTELRRGLTYKEIASNLGKSPKSIDNAIQRIKKKIYEFLEY